MEATEHCGTPVRCRAIVDLEGTEGLSSHPVMQQAQGSEVWPATTFSKVGLSLDPFLFLEDRMKAPEEWELSCHRGRLSCT